MDNDTYNNPLEVVETSALEQMERASIDIQIATAKRFPRNITSVKRQMAEFATLDVETAESCFYSLKRKERDGSQKIIQGPSIRMAEIALSSFANIRAGSRVIANDGKTITAQGVVHDLQNNVCVSIEVKTRITTKSGATYGEDMQVVAGNAACAKALRNAVFKVVPLALVLPVLEQAKRIAIGEGKPMSERRSLGLAYFERQGIAREKIFASLGVAGIDDISVVHLEHLTGLKTAIKDGETTLEEAFATAKDEVKTLAGILSAAGAAETKAPAQAPAPVADAKKTAPAKTEEAPEDRDALIARIKGLLIDHEVTEEALLAKAVSLKLKPDECAALFELPTANLSKLAFSVAAISTKGKK